MVFNEIMPVKVSGNLQSPPRWGDYVNECHYYNYYNYICSRNHCEGERRLGWVEVGVGRAGLPEQVRQPEPGQSKMSPSGLSWTRSPTPAPFYPEDPSGWGPQLKAQAELAGF